MLKVSDLRPCACVCAVLVGGSMCACLSPDCQEGVLGNQSQCEF